ncbi:MAG: Gfo/Idh/MocA family oxidoreductase [Candidatus Latescibacterota bacterium]|nr:Gfo/Idh/MocA family oxidoreductase [Candidatus Latescibacterota bacterium]
MALPKHTVGIIGCGRMGQHYVEIYQTLPDTEVVAIAEHNPERRKAVGERFGVTGLYVDAEEMFQHVTPDLAAVVLPGKYIKEAVVAAAQAGVKGVSADKPIGARLSDVDEMVTVCEERNVVFAGGNLQRAMGEVQEAAAWLRAGEFGRPRGASVHGWGGEISGGGCQHIAVLRLFTHAEIAEIVAWGSPLEALKQEDDHGLVINAQCRMSNDLSCSIYGTESPQRGVDVWTEDSLLRWDWAPPEIWQGFDETGQRIKRERHYTPIEYPHFTYLGTSIRSFIDVVTNGGELAISGNDLRQSLEVAIAAKYSALWGSVPVSLPLQDRSLTLYPRPYRWLGGDQSGVPQSYEEALSDPLFSKK